MLLELEWLDEELELLDELEELLDELLLLEEEETDELDEELRTQPGEVQVTANPDLVTPPSEVNRITM
jgi:hypothetical protein